MKIYYKNWKKKIRKELFQKDPTWFFYYRLKILGSYPKTQSERNWDVQAPLNENWFRLGVRKHKTETLVIGFIALLLLLKIFSFSSRNKFVNGAKIPLFDDAIEECLRNGQRMIIDIKEKGLEIVQIIIDAFKKNPDLYRKAIVSSFNPIIIYMVSFYTYIVNHFGYRKKNDL